MANGALLSDCGKYRFVLWREFEDVDEGYVVNFVMLNPSTADAEKDDPTVRRCMGFARQLGARQLFITNLYAYRATDPKDLQDNGFPVGQHNDRYLLQHAGCSDIVVCAWGSRGQPERQHHVARLLGSRKTLYCLGTTRGGSPRHPLFLAKDTPFLQYIPAPGGGPFTSQVDIINVAK